MSNAKIYERSFMFIGDIAGSINKYPDGKILKVAFRLHTAYSYKNDVGLYRKRDEYFPVAAWGEMALRILDKFELHDYVLIKGYPAHTSWIDKTTGKKRLAVEFVVVDIKKLPYTKPKPKKEPIVEFGSVSVQPAEPVQDDDDEPYSYHIDDTEYYEGEL